MLEGLPVGGALPARQLGEGLLGRSLRCTPPSCFAGERLRAAPPLTWPRDPGRCPPADVAAATSGVKCGVAALLVVVGEWKLRLTTAAPLDSVEQHPPGKSSGRGAPANWESCRSVSLA